MNVSTRTLIALLFVLVVLLFVTSWIHFGPGHNPRYDIAPKPAPFVIPHPTPSDMEEAQPAHGFQLLVSYTDGGFQPNNASVRLGDTVRFTNNSATNIKLWIAADGRDGAIYPRDGEGCGSSAIDSCHAIERGRYWEFTFTKKGTWSYTNNLDKTQVGTITVQ